MLPDPWCCSVYRQLPLHRVEVPRSSKSPGGRGVPLPKRLKSRDDEPWQYDQLRDGLFGRGTPRPPRTAAHLPALGAFLWCSFSSRSFCLRRSSSRRSLSTFFCCSLVSGNGGAGSEHLRPTQVSRRISWAWRKARIGKRLGSRTMLLSS